MMRQFLEMSTIHIHPADLETVHGLIKNGDWASAYTSTAGVFIWTGYGQSEDCPPRLGETLKTLEADEIDYVLFDRDAAQNHGFTSYEEDWP